MAKELTPFEKQVVEDEKKAEKLFQEKQKKSVPVEEKDEFVAGNLQPVNKPPTLEPAEKPKGN